MCLSVSSRFRSVSASSNKPARLRRYQNILLLEKGTPRRLEPGCGLIPTNRIFAFFESLYLIMTFHFHTRAGCFRCWAEYQNIHHPRFCPLPPCQESFRSLRTQCVQSTSPFCSRVDFQLAIEAARHTLQAVELGSSHRPADISR